MLYTKVDGDSFNNTAADFQVSLNVFHSAIPVSLCLPTTHLFVVRFLRQVPLLHLFLWQAINP